MKFFERRIGLKHSWFCCWSWFAGNFLIICANDQHPGIVFYEDYVMVIAEAKHNSLPKCYIADAFTPLLPKVCLSYPASFRSCHIRLCQEWARATWSRRCEVMKAWLVSGWSGPSYFALGHLVHFKSMPHYSECFFSAQSSWINVITDLWWQHCGSMSTYNMFYFLLKDLFCLYLATKLLCYVKLVRKAWRSAWPCCQEARDFRSAFVAYLDKGFSRAAWEDRPSKLQDGTLSHYLECERPQDSEVLVSWKGKIAVYVGWYVGLHCSSLAARVDEWGGQSGQGGYPGGDSSRTQWAREELSQKWEK